MDRQEGPTLQELADIADYHNDVVRSIRGYLQRGFLAGDPSFLEYTAARIQDRIGETELRSSLVLFATIEAALRTDARLRLKMRKKDGLSRALRKSRILRKGRLRLDSLLDFWTEHHPETREAVGELRTAFHLRHWLAHGRYGPRPKNGRFDYVTLYRLAEVILVQFPLMHEE